MGNATVAGALDELYRLDASETAPEDDPADGQDAGGDDEAEPEGMPHPIEPDGMPHPIEPDGMPHPIEPEGMPHP